MRFWLSVIRNSHPNDKSGSRGGKRQYHQVTWASWRVKSTVSGNDAREVAVYQFEPGTLAAPAFAAYQSVWRVRLEHCAQFGIWYLTLV